MPVNGQRNWLKRINRQLVIEISVLFLLAAAVSYGLYMTQDFFWPLAVVPAVCSAAVLWRVRFHTESLFREITQLSDYLQDLEKESWDTDIRDNREGPLSILKNDIYKLVTRLQHASVLAEEERVHMNRALAEMSHQLKTPLTALQVISDLLRDESLPAEKRAEFLVSMDRQLTRLSWIIQSLLKFSRFDAGTMVLAEDKIDLRELADNVRDQLAIAMELRGQSLEIKGAPDLFFTGDFKWISEALINIVKNCSEHSAAGSVVRLDYRKTPQYVQVEIMDRGSGIAPGDLPNIFKRFYRGRNAGTESVGIGLAMARTIIEHEGGYITVQSEVGKGSVFDIKFYQ